MSSNTICLLVKQGKKTSRICVDPAWVSRWQFLSDIIEDVGGGDVEWEYGYVSELQTWVKLNELMDTEVPIRHPEKGKKLEEMGIMSEPIPLSSVLHVVQFMNPVDNSYLLHCSIDDKLQDNVRRENYKLLGEYIRNRGDRMEPLYYNIDPEQDVPGIYYNFYLNRDPAYGYEVNMHLIALREMSEDVQQFIRDLPLATVTGVFYQAYYRTITKGYKETKEDKWMEEVPWYLIDWKDVALFCASEIRVLRREYGILSDIRGLIEADAIPAAHLQQIGQWRRPREFHVARLQGFLEINHDKAILPFILSDVPLPERYDSYGGDVYVTLVYNKKGVVSLQIPHAADFMTRIANYIKRKEYKIYGGEDLYEGAYNVYYLIASNSLRKPTKINRKKVHELWYAMQLVNIAVICNTSKDRIVDSLEYPAIAERIASTLGISMLEGYTKFLYDIVEENLELPDPAKDMIRARIELFVEAAIQVIAAAEGDGGFVEWPTIEEVEEKREMVKKP